MSARILDHIAPLFLITPCRECKKRIHDLAKRGKVVRPEQAAARRKPLEVVDVPHGRPGNGHAEKDSVGRAGPEVAHDRPLAPAHAVMKPKGLAPARMERMGDHGIAKVTRCFATACICEHSIAAPGASASTGPSGTGS